MSQMQDRAMDILLQLNRAGYKAYLVGGCVRDMKLNLKPKDYDVATNALPERVIAVIGGKHIAAAQAYPVVIVDGIEVATFRKDGKNRNDAEGMQVGATIYDDANRRDFTVNALYMDYAHRILDPTGWGLYDLKNNTLRFIGNPMERILEDPCRLLRAVRLSLKLAMEIEHKSLEAMKSVGLTYSNWNMEV